LGHCSPFETTAIDDYQGDCLSAAAFSGTTITIFASRANPTLAEMIVCEGCAECGYRVLDRLSAGDVAAQLNVHLVELLVFCLIQLHPALPWREQSDLVRVSPRE
jgi:hypothetical protein